MTHRTRGISLLQLIEELRPYLIGWRGYFGFCQTPRVLANLGRGSAEDYARIFGGSGRTGTTASMNCAVVAYPSSMRRSPPVRRPVSGACPGVYRATAATGAANHLDLLADRLCPERPVSAHLARCRAPRRRSGIHPLRPISARLRRDHRSILPSHSNSALEVDRSRPFAVIRTGMSRNRMGFWLVSDRFLLPIEHSRLARRTSLASARHAGAGGARSRAINERMSANICRDTATSAIWKVT